jgi:tRNA nucleotidyltransferase (CCA-adding enzyme)
MVSNYSEVRKKVLSQIKPSISEKKRFEKDAIEVINKIETIFAQKNVNVKVSIGGSIAKNTQLKNAKDIDLFLKFPPIPYAHKDISEITHKTLKKHYKEIKRIHATRDYFHIFHDNILFELIPVIEVPNATVQHRIMDASPHHVSYVKEKLKNNDEVRLLKKFLKAQKLYGAESHIRGFSGYVCELLIIIYTTFKKLMENAAEWNVEGEFFDIEKHYETKEEALEIMQNGNHNPIIIIDPVQSNRNASASIDHKTYRKFIRMAQIFNRKPNLSAFNKPLINYTGSGIIIKIKNNDEKDETLPAKIRSLHERLIRELNDFIVTGEDWDYDDEKRTWESRIWLGTFLLPKLEEIQGPPINLENSVDAFLKKHSRTLEKESRIYAIEKRKIRTPEPIINNVIKESKHFNKRMRVKIERREKL